MLAFAGWNSFFVAEVSAAAALSGLLFVAVSINIAEILKYPQLPTRAAETIGMLMAALIEGSLALVPHQSYGALGVEVLAVGGVVLVVPLGLMWRRRQVLVDDAESRWLVRVALSVA